ncbi:MAG: NAD(P)/FAD-dependent oxidoreductase [Burkholderiaceae bacterium]|jgi:thioredoxin reductase (NADPH)|nr:NAD(P)/FAD-dependent oxidoreductase [Burkholderiaceae bacterium]
MNAATALAPIDTDALVIGAGPVGLYQVFQLGLLGARAHVIDALPRPGGQPVELYPDKLIYDLPGLAACTGQQLTDALLAQIAPFVPVFHFGREAYALRRLSDGRWEVVTHSIHAPGECTLRARAVFIAAGAGAFAPRPLKLPGIEAWQGRQLFYRSPDDPARLPGRRILILGGGQAALDCAVALAQLNRYTVTLAHRREHFQADDEIVAHWRALQGQGRVQFIAGQPVGFEAEGDCLTALRIAGHEGAQCRVALDAVIVLQGLSPRLGPIANWGLALERKQLAVDPERCATGAPGIFAVGDINTYPGKRKLLVCGFHEATLAAWGAWPVLFPGQPNPPLLYTSSSAHLQTLLGAR